MTAAKEFSRDEIVEAFNRGVMIELVFSGFGNVGPESRKAIIATCAGLHNEGVIDLLSLAEPQRLEGVSISSFYTGQHFFCEVIPLLNGPADHILRAVTALVDRAGDNLASNQPNAAFRDWCAVEAGRSHQIVAMAKEGEPLASKLLTFALEAWNLVDEALELARECSDGRLLSAITALGRMRFSSEAAAHRVISGLAEVLDRCPRDEVFCNVLLSVIAVAKRIDGTGDAALDQVTRIAETPAPSTVGCCAQALCLHGESLSLPVTDVLLHCLASANISDDSTARRLDNALRAVLESPNADRAIDFAGRVAIVAGETLDPSRFESFLFQLRHGPQDRLHRTLVAWLLSGNRTLCEWATSLLTTAAGEEKAVELPPDTLQITDREKHFLCRKAIGYLFTHPVSCASLLVSVLRACDDEVGNTIARLLFDPMLVNYGGAIREYLETIEPNDSAHSFVRRALDRADDHLRSLPPQDAIKELHPSAHERQIEYRLMAAEMATAMREAERNSVLLSLVTRSVLLYGRRSLSFFELPGGERRPVEVALESHSVSFEMPRMQIVDPVGLEYMLRVFQAERLET